MSKRIDTTWGYPDWVPEGMDKDFAVHVIAAYSILRQPAKEATRRLGELDQGHLQLFGTVQAGLVQVLGALEDAIGVPDELRVVVDDKPY